MRHDKGVLIVRATPAAHKRLATYLGKLRAWNSTTGAKKPVTVTMDAAGTFFKVESPVMKGRVVASFGETVEGASIRVRTEPAGPPLVITLEEQPPLLVSKTKTKDGTYRMLYKTALPATREAALKARAAKLREAANLLASAGDHEGAARVRKHAAAALQQMAEQRRQMERARVKFDVDERSLVRRKSSGDVLGAVEGLRKEVGALRNDVRELTALVRKLVERRR